MNLLDKKNIDIILSNINEIVDKMKDNSSLTTAKNNYLINVFFQLEFKKS